ncbi:hypothetical protein [Huintestinicola sp.]
MNDVIAHLVSVPLLSHKMRLVSVSVPLLSLKMRLVSVSVPLLSLKNAA